MPPDGGAPGCGVLLTSCDLPTYSFRPDFLYVSIRSGKYRMMGYRSIRCGLRFFGVSYINNNNNNRLVEIDVLLVEIIEK